MKRVLAPILVGLGAFLLALAVLLPTVVVPRFEKVPQDLYSVTQASGPGSYLDLTRLQMVPDDTITVIRTITGDVEASTEDVGVYTIAQNTEADAAAEPLNVITERSVQDRVTGQGTGGPGDRPSHEDAYTFKLPFNTNREEYLVHDPTAADAFPMTFQRVTEIDGLEVFEFTGTVPEQVLQSVGVPGSFVGAPGVLTVFSEEIYSTDRTILVEPRTGSIVSTTQSPRKSLRPADIGTPAGEETVTFEAELTATPETVADLVADAKDAKGQLDLYGRTLPLLLGVLGVAALLAGVLLLLRGRRDDSDGYNGGAHAADDNNYASKV